MPGPVPKRSDQRRRRNASQFGLDKVAGVGVKPDLELEGVHSLASAWYESLAVGAEAQYYTPAMWQRARITARVMSDFLMSSKPSSMMYTALQQDMKSLLVDAGELRRLGIEVQAAEAESGANVIDWRARASAGA